MQWRAEKYILKLPFCCDTDYKTRLQMTRLLPLFYCHEYHDIVFFYKTVNNLIYVNKEVLPVVRNVGIVTRSSSSSAVSFIPMKCKTVTYQRSFFVRACRIWNVLPLHLCHKDLSLASFTKLLRNYYIEIPLPPYTTRMIFKPGSHLAQDATLLIH